MDRYSEIKQGESGIWLSIVVYISLSILKIGIGYMTGSEALRADGLNNVTDIVASIAVLVGLKISQRPPDHDHPYGHFRAESIASLIASFIMVSVGIQVLYQAFSSIALQQSIVPDLTAAWTALTSAAIMYGVYRYNLKLSKKIKSQSVFAAAQDNRSDAWVSIGAATGIFGAQLGLPWLDPLAAFVVGILIIKTAWEIFRGASLTLTDGIEIDQLQELEQSIRLMREVESVRDLKARSHGNRLLVDVIILVHPELNVAESHKITEEIERRLIREHRVSHVHIHVEPSSKK